MRRLRLLFVVLLPTVTGAVIACESETNNGPPAIVIDSGTIDSPTNPPTPPGDATPPTPATAVTVSVVGFNAPKSGVLVVFHDANGAVLESKPTGADGKVTSTGASPPAMASVLTSAGENRFITTWTALEGGDELVLRDVGPQTQGTYDISLPGPFDGALNYSGRIGYCETSGVWNGQTPKSLELESGCAQTQNGILVHALNGEGRTIAHAFAKNVALPPGAAAAPVTVGAFAAPTDVTVSVTNAPEAGGNTPSIDLSETIGPIAYRLAATATQPGSRTFPTATGFAETLQATGSVNSGGGSSRILLRRVAAPVAGNAIALDMATVLPRVTEGIANMADPRRPEISIGVDSPLTGADGGYVRLYTSLASESQLTWTFVVPASAASVKAPALPPAGDEWIAVPDSGAQNTFLDIVFADSEAVADFKAFRRLPVTGGAYGGNSFVVNGTTRLTGWGNGG